jgi:hypothetical protein
MLWRFSANHTHLYPGALLRCLDTPGEARLSAGDELLVEFSDGASASGARRPWPRGRGASLRAERPAWCGYTGASRPECAPLLPGSVRTCGKVLP